MMSFGILIIDIQMQRSLQSPSQTLTGIKTLQFIAEFFLNSNFKIHPQLLSEFLLGFQALKFFFRIQSFHKQGKVYLEIPKENKKQNKFILSIDKDQISDKTSETGSTMYKKNKLTINEIKGRWKNGILNLLNVPEVEKYEQKERSFVNVLGEILTLFRPLLTIVAIRIFGIKSFKPFLISLFIDLIVTFLLHKGIKAESEDEREQIIKRRKQLIIRYLFKDPVYNSLRMGIIKPLVGKVFKEDGMFHKFIISLFDMQSSLTLNL